MAKEATTQLDKPAKATTLDRIREKKVDVAKMSYEDLFATLNAEQELLDAADAGDGFKLISGEGDKRKLVGVPFIVIDWKENESSRFPGRTFYTLRIKTVTNENVIVNDGGAGIRSQLASFDEQGRHGAIACRHGFRVSEYEVEDESGAKVLDPATKQPIRSRTYYLDTAV